LFSDAILYGPDTLGSSTISRQRETLIAASTGGGNIGFLPSLRAAEKPQKREPDGRRKGAAIFMWMT
jgi:hypothetical protein